jgi:hypothetical protein
MFRSFSFLFFFVVFFSALLIPSFVGWSVNGAHLREIRVFVCVLSFKKEERKKKKTKDKKKNIRLCFFVL